MNAGFSFAILSIGVTRMPLSRVTGSATPANNLLRHTLTDHIFYFAKDINVFYSFQDLQL